MKIILFAISFCVTGFLFSQSTSNKVLEFAKQNLGKKVDRGECWDLASFALNDANANWEPPFNFGTKVDYKKQALLPGDILQMTNVKFIFPNGSASFPKHTAIVYKTNNKMVTLIHQNFNNKKKVDTLSINFDNIKNGKIEAYRPQPKN